MKAPAQHLACDHIDVASLQVMTVADPESLAQASAMFRALGDPQRLRLLVRLAAGETCVTELAAHESEKISTVSARLKALHAVRLVTSRREARHIFYSLADDHVLTVVQSAIDHASESQPKRITPSTKEHKT
jgi:ArsR family transcriptional regulator